ncbi:MAG: PD-(D/E)XK nuclease family protein [Bacteroidaceae bacterium]|nr:PD-(D/E)XK nuclease family protein [Bacteroidaceae bacterium]
MKPFLQLVAEDLLRRTPSVRAMRTAHGTETSYDLSRTLVVFPGKRPNLFMDDYLATTETPVFSPRYVTISELFQLFCPLAIADPIDVACQIYAIYAREETRQGQKPDTLDHFYGWAERILADFEDIDKALVDAERLFVNLADLREIDAGNFLTEEQKDVLRTFFREFDVERNSYIRDKFLHLWRMMPHIYATLTATLESEGMAYTGMLQRRAVENLTQGYTSPLEAFDRVAIVGFNVLSATEEKLFKCLQKEIEVLFYWDYDTYYMPRNGVTKGLSEAGYYMSQNLKTFPNALSEEYFSNFLQPKEIAFISAQSDAAQACYIAPWLREHTTADPRRTAIVLCDEHLLQPVLHALPDTVESFNITKGYPLAATNAYSDTLRLADDLERRAVEPIDFLTRIEEAMSQSPAVQRQAMEPADILEQEARFSIFTICSRLKGLLQRGRLTLQTPTLRKLLRGCLRTHSIAFHGEPAEGLQIMGLLETRCLDFEHVLLLSADDKNIPGVTHSSSFIPYFLREAYGLQTHRHQAALYSYYFHRLLSRSKSVTALWKDKMVGSSGGGEMSRFMMQLLIEAPSLHIHCGRLQTVFQPFNMHTLTVPKPENIAQYVQSLSPSALNTYMKCSLAFYFSRVARMRAYHEPRGEMQVNDFGSIFHGAAQYLYLHLTSSLAQPVTAAHIRTLLERGADVLIEDCLQRAFLDVQRDNTTLKGKLADYPVQHNILVRQLHDLLRADMRLGHVEIVALEEESRVSIEVHDSSGEPVSVQVGGIVDRIDIVSEQDGSKTFRILDYKTGKKKSKESFSSIEKLFQRGAERAAYVFQTFVYALAMQEHTTLPIRPALYYTSEAYKPDYDPYVKLGRDNLCDVRPLLGEFQAGLSELVTEILDVSIPFEANPSRDCKYCDFSAFCPKTQL